MLKNRLWPINNPFKGVECASIESEKEKKNMTKKKETMLYEAHFIQLPWDKEEGDKELLNDTPFKFFATDAETAEKIALGEAARIHNSLDMKQLEVLVRPFAE